MAAVCGGLGVLAFAAGGRRDPRAIAAALLTGASIAAYTVLDGVGVREAGARCRTRRCCSRCRPQSPSRSSRRCAAGRLVTALDRRQWLLGLGGGVFAMAGYGIVLWAQTRGTLASVAALRETGVISGAVIGAVFFSERLGARRVAAACVVAAGVVLITAH